MLLAAKEQVVEDTVLLIALSDAAFPLAQANDLAATLYCRLVCFEQQTLKQFHALEYMRVLAILARFRRAEPPVVCDEVSLFCEAILLLNTAHVEFLWNWCLLKGHIGE